MVVVSLITRVLLTKIFPDMGSLRPAFPRDWMSEIQIPHQDGISNPALLAVE